MANYSTYATLSELRREVRLSESNIEHDVNLLRVLETVSEWIDEYCGRWFGVREGSRYYTASDAQVLLLDADLLSVTELGTDEDDDGEYETEWASSDYRLHPLNNWPKWKVSARGRSFPYGVEAGVRVTGQWGYGGRFEDTPYTASGATITVADATSATVSVSDQSLLAIGQTILVGSEQMYIAALTGDEDNGDTATVVRGVNGTTATAQAAAAAYIYQYPGVVREACLLQAQRLWRRSDAPFGITGSADMGVAVIARLDPDVRALLDSVRLARVG